MIIRASFILCLFLYSYSQPARSITHVKIGSLGWILLLVPALYLMVQDLKWLFGYTENEEGEPMVVPLTEDTPAPSSW